MADTTKLRTQLVPQFIANCTVVDLGSGSYPRLITVRTPQADGAAQVARWYGNRRLAVGDTITCRRDPYDLDVLAIDESGDAQSLLHKFDATAAPTTGDDDADGYAVGSIWIDVTNDDAHICVDASTGAAVWEQINGGGGGGYPFDVLSVDFVDSDADYATVKLAEAAASSGDTIKVGPGSNDEATLTINVAVKIIGQGIDVTTVTSDGTDYVAVYIDSVAVILAHLTVASTGAFAGSCQGITINSASGCTLRHVKASASAASTTASGILCAGATTHTLDQCEAYANGSGTTKYGLQVSSGCTVVVTGGYYDGDTADIYNNGGTLTLRGPVLANATIIGTWEGYYFTADGKRVDNREGWTYHLETAPSGFTNQTYSPFTTANLVETYSKSTRKAHFSGGTAPLYNYFAESTSTKSMKARCQPLGVGTSAGIRLDINNTSYVMLFLSFNASTYKVDLTYQTHSVGATVIASGLPPAMYSLQIVSILGSWFGYYGQENGFFITANLGSDFTPTRRGLFFGNVSSAANSVYAGLFEAML